MSTTHSRTWDCGKPTKHNLSKAVKMLPGQTNDRISRKSRFTGSDAPKRSLNFRLRTSSPLQPNYSLESISSTSQYTVWQHLRIHVCWLASLWKTDMFTQILSFIGQLGLQDERFRSMNPQKEGIYASGQSLLRWVRITRADLEFENISGTNEIEKNDFRSSEASLSHKCIRNSLGKWRSGKSKISKITGKWWKVPTLTYA